MLFIGIVSVLKGMYLLLDYWVWAKLKVEI